MEDAEESIKSMLKHSLLKQSHVNNNNHNETVRIGTTMLRVKYDFLDQTRALNLNRPVQFDELYQKISVSLNNQNGLLLHYMSPTKEIFGLISNQSELEQIVQCVDRNTKYRSLRILVTTASPLRTNSTPTTHTAPRLRPDSPPPGCLHPNDHIHMERSTSFPISHADGEFIPEDDATSTSHSGNSSYSSSRQSLLDNNWASGGRRSKLTNIPLYPNLPENDHGSNNQKISTFPLRIHPSSNLKPEGRQTLPHLRNHPEPSELIYPMALDSSRNSNNFNPDYEKFRGSLDKTITRARTPSLIDYKKGPLLGRGGFGQVFKCLDSNTGAEFAMKEVLLSPNGGHNNNAISKDVECLENEINIYRNLMCHQRIVQYFGVKRDQNAMYIFMEYMAGGSIKDQLRQYGPLSHTIIARYVKQILQGLAFLHQKMIIHRDIKAANILRDIDGNVKLSDFGASRYLKSISVHNTSHRTAQDALGSAQTPHNNGGQVANSFCGTFFWMAPEVIRGESYSISADVWSLGATIVEMLTGHPPYYDLEPYAALFKIANTSKIEYPECPEPIGPQLLSLINTMFVFNPQERASAESLLRSDFISALGSH